MQLDLFITKYTYSHFNGGKSYSFEHLPDLKKPKYDPYKAYMRWTSEKHKHYDMSNPTYSDLSKGF